ncbi:MAG: hypothetical protein J5767_12415 [Paludibacteraceae bacterium]|nr:hypothetical protein [Paludibacteraceae bacterium]
MKKKSEVKPKYKTRDFVIPKIHTQEGILRGFPVEIVGIIVNHDEGISYQLRSYNNMVIKESEIIAKSQKKQTSQLDNTGNNSYENHNRTSKRIHSRVSISR